MENIMENLSEAIEQSNIAPDSKERKVVDAALLAGELLMISGAEAFRVENTVYRILNTVNHADAQVLAIMTGFFMTLHTEEGHHITSVYRINKRSWDLDKIQEVNRISRAFTSGQIDVDEAIVKLQEVKEKKKNRLVTNLAQIFASAFFVMMIGGSASDFMVAVFTGAILVLFQLLIGYDRHLSDFISTIIYATVLSTTSGILANTLFPTADAAIVTIGTLVILFPGIMMSNGIRDLMQGDTLTGIGFLVQAIISAAALSIGSAIGIMMTGGSLL